MHTFIDFPNLGIHLEHVGKTLTVFGFDIAYYGIVIGLGMLAGIGMAMMEAKRTGQNQEDYLDLAIFAIIFGIIGARIYYVVFAWGHVQRQPAGDLQNPARRPGHLRRRHRGGHHGVRGGPRQEAFRGPHAGHGRLGLVTGQMIGRWGKLL